MGWFRSAPGPSSSAPPATLDPGASRIAPGTKIIGRLEGPTEVMIDGELEGQVRLEGAVLVGSHGAVRGELSAKVVRIAGRVYGNVHGGERIELLAGGSVEGDLAAPRVIVHEGAFLTGKVVMHEIPAPSGRGAKSAPSVVAGTEAGQEPPVTVRPAQAAAVQEGSTEPSGEVAAEEGGAQQGGKHQARHGGREKGPREKPTQAGAEDDGAS